jgi:hypothetical protein
MAELTTADVQQFLEALAVSRRVTASTQNPAFSAWLYFFEQVLQPPPGDLKGMLRARRSERLPVVLGRAEVASPLDG